MLALPLMLPLASTAICPSPESSPLACRGSVPAASVARSCSASRSSEYFAVVTPCALRFADAQAKLRNRQRAFLPRDRAGLLLMPRRHAMRRQFDVAQRAGPALRVRLPTALELKRCADLLALCAQLQVMQRGVAGALQMHAVEVQARCVHATQRQVQIATRMRDVRDRGGELQVVDAARTILQTAALQVSRDGKFRPAALEREFALQLAGRIRQPVAQRGNVQRDIGVGARPML